MDTTSDRQLVRIGAVAAIAGALLLFGSTLLHPLEADPNDALAAFQEYAADRLWVATHLGQLLGVAAIVAAMVALARTLDEGRATAWSRVGVAGAVASLAVTAVLQAVDGVALKFMVDKWAAAPAGQRDVIFEAAFGVRQIEIGLSSTMSFLFGLTVIVFGLAMVQSRTYPAWLGWIGLVGGLATATAGVALAFTGFSGLAMMISMPASIVVLVWVIATGVVMWRDGTTAAATRVS